MQGACRAPLLKSLAVASLAAGLAACGGHVDEATDCPAAQKAKSLSGYCIPRWVSLKHGEVMGRKGPGKDYPALWEYKAQGLPVQIVAETEEWRRICDPEGGAAWVHRSEIDGRRQVLSRADAQLPIRRAPRSDAKVTALLNGHAMARLDRCQGDWCKVKVGGASGWLAADMLWGVAQPPQCR